MSQILYAAVAGGNPSERHGLTKMEGGIETALPYLPTRFDFVLSTHHKIGVFRERRQAIGQRGSWPWCLETAAQMLAQPFLRDILRYFCIRQALESDDADYYRVCSFESPC